MKTKLQALPASRRHRSKAGSSSIKRSPKNSMQLSCKEIAKHICGELDEHLDSPQCRAIKKHMESCPNCTAYLDSMKKTVHFYQSYSGPRLSSQCRKELYTMLKLRAK